MRHIFIGDLHGCIDEFRDLIDKLALRSDDHVICLGDFMDKGPDPAGCVRFARESGFKSILGNHEEKHIKWRVNEARAKKDPFYKNGMKPFDAIKADQNAALSDEDVVWLSKLPVMMEFKNLHCPDLVAVHGGLFPKLSLKDQPLDKILRARYVDANGKHLVSDFDSLSPVPSNGVHWATVYDGIHDVVYGHEAHSLSTIRVDHNQVGAMCYGIDTGCVHGGRLTALVKHDTCNFETVQVQARRVYQEPPWPIPA